MSERKSTQEEFVLSYLQELGIAPSRNVRQFLADLSSRHGRTIAKQLEGLMADRARGESGEEIYTAKNQSLPLSLDFARFSADLYRRFFDWLTLRFQEHVPCRSVLDIGCDNGLVTCFLARLFPKATVVGLDRSEAAIRCALQLAERLRLDNVVFVCQDFLETVQLPPLPTDAFDLVVSLRAVHEMVAEPFTWRFWSLGDLVEKLQASAESTRYQAVLGKVKSLLTPGTGLFISGERLVHAGMVLEWLWSIQQAGLSIRWPETTWLCFHEVGDAQRIPVVTAIAQEEDQALLPAAYEFLGAGDPVDLREGDTWTDIRAEGGLQKAQGRRLIGGIQIDYQGGVGSERFEWWAWRDNVLAYRYTDLGYRELTKLGQKTVDDWEAEAVRLEMAYRHAGVCTRY